MKVSLASISCSRRPWWELLDEEAVLLKLPLSHGATPWGHVEGQQLSAVSTPGWNQCAGVLG